MRARRSQFKSDVPAVGLPRPVLLFFPWDGTWEGRLVLRSRPPLPVFVRGAGGAGRGPPRDPPLPLHSRKPGLLTSVPSPRSLRAVSLRELEQTVSSINWPRVVASGALWTMVYNFVWGAAWFAFMRREWLDAMAAIERPMPFTAEVWFLMVVLSLPIGVAIMAYAAGRARSATATKTAVYASLPLWLLMTLGMAGWGWQDSISMRVIALDSIVNLVALVAASLAGGWSQREA